MAGIVKEFRIYYRRDDDPRTRPNRFATVVLADRLDGTFEVTDREGDTVPEPFHGDDEVAGISISDLTTAQQEFEQRCNQLETDGGDAIEVSSSVNPSAPRSPLPVDSTRAASRPDHRT